MFFLFTEKFIYLLIFSIIYLDDRSVFSDDTCAASLYGDDLPSPSTVMNPTGPSSLDRWTGQAPSPLLLEQLGQEMSARGSPKAEVQLR